MRVGRRTATVAAVVMALALGACSDDDDGNGGAEPQATLTTGVPTSVTTSASGSATTDSAGCATDDGARLAVAARDFTFDPGCLRVRVDQELVVTNAGRVTHNVTVAGTYDQDLEPGTSFATVNVGGSLQPGTYDLVCQFHEARGMSARLEVVEPRQ